MKKLIATNPKNIVIPKSIVIPVKAGIQPSLLSAAWIPAFVGMTVCAVLLFISPVHAAPHAFPVPFVSKQHKMITFKDLPNSGTVKIFTINGERVVSLPIPTGAGKLDWNVKNGSGESVATGVYFFQINSSSGKTTGKLVVIR